jgi:hypothetical protein
MQSIAIIATTALSKWKHAELMRANAYYARSIRSQRLHFAA